MTTTRSSALMQWSSAATILERCLDMVRDKIGRCIRGDNAVCSPRILQLWEITRMCRRIKQLMQEGGPQCVKQSKLMEVEETARVYMNEAYITEEEDPLHFLAGRWQVEGTIQLSRAMLSVVGALIALWFFTSADMQETVSDGCRGAVQGAVECLLRYLEQYLEKQQSEESLLELGASLEGFTDSLALALVQWERREVTTAAIEQAANGCSETIGAKVPQVPVAA